MNKNLQELKRLLENTLNRIDEMLLREDVSLDENESHVTWNMSAFKSAPLKGIWFGAFAQCTIEDPHVHVNPTGKTTTHSRQRGTFKVWLNRGGKVELAENYGADVDLVNRVIRHISQNQQKFLGDWNKFVKLNTQTGELKYGTAEEADAAAKAAKKQRKRQGKMYAIPDDPADG